MLDINHLCVIILTVNAAMTNQYQEGGVKMATSTLKKVSVSVRLDNGTDADGNTITVGLGLGSINKDTFNADKVLAIVGVLEPCLNKTVDSVEKTEVSTITAA